MKFTEDFIKDNGLSEQQVTNLTTAIDANEATLKGEWDGKANTDAEAIIQGAMDSTISKFGIEGFKRRDGEKSAIALGRINSLVIDSALIKERAEVSKMQRDLSEKIKNGGDEILKGELDALKVKYDTLQQMEAKFKDWEDNDWKGKYETQSKEIESGNVIAAFNNAKPNFPDTVNKYEANAKWLEFVNGIKEKYNVEKSQDGSYVLVDKTNKHSTTTIEALATKDETITSLSQGRNKTGFGGGEKSKIKIDGVPFQLPENATSSERSKAIKEYLLNDQKLSFTSKQYSDEYARLNKLILEKNP